MAHKLSLWLFGVVAVGACTVQSSEGDEPAWPEGIYGNVSVSEETSDLGGFEVRFYEDAGKRMAEFVLCEGWCNRAYRAEIKRDGDVFRFSHVEEFLVDGEQGATRTEGHLVEYSVVHADDGLRYSQAYDGEPIALDLLSSSLTPLKEPFGLTVAKGE